SRRRHTSLQGDWSSDVCSTDLEKTFTATTKLAQQITSTETKICAVDLNINEHIAVCTIQTVEGTILATRFIGGGREIAGFRKSRSEERRVGKECKSRRWRSCYE